MGECLRRLGSQWCTLALRLQNVSEIGHKSNDAQDQEKRLPKVWTAAIRRSTKKTQIRRHENKKGIDERLHSPIQLKPRAQEGAWRREHCSYRRSLTNLENAGVGNRHVHGSIRTDTGARARETGRNERAMQANPPHAQTSIRRALGAGRIVHTDSDDLPPPIHLEDAVDAAEAERTFLDWFLFGQADVRLYE